MEKNNNLIYDFMEHGLYYSKPMEYGTEEIIALTIDTLQIDIDYLTGEILSVTGFLPLFKADKYSLVIPRTIVDEFRISVKNIEYKKGIAYDFFKFFPQSKIYFIDKELPVLKFDENNKRILLGAKDDSDTRSIRVNNNIICNLDSKDNLKGIMILIDSIIK